MWENGARWLSSGTHSDRALCLASWRAEPAGLPRGLAEVLPWALTACGLAWSRRTRLRLQTHSMTTPPRRGRGRRSCAGCGTWAMCDDWRNAEQRVVEHWRTRWEDKKLDMGPPLLNDLRLVELVEESCGPVSGRSVLEVGAGEGSISAAFADQGATVSLIDSAPKSVEHCLRRLAALGYQARGEVAVASRLPFADREFDFVVSGGLLEHFEPPLRVRILREMGRVCRGWVVTLIPNGGDGFYGLAKWQLQQTGRWPWGEEHSIASLTEDYSAAGLEMAREVSYDATNSLMLLTDALGLTPEQTQAMTRWAQARGGELGLCGYRLLAIGRAPSPEAHV